jgi:hypothetical protein
MSNMYTEFSLIKLDTLCPVCLVLGRKIVEKDNISFTFSCKQKIGGPRRHSLHELAKAMRISYTSFGLAVPRYVEDFINNSEPITNEFGPVSP